MTVRTGLVVLMTGLLLSGCEDINSPTSNLSDEPTLSVNFPNEPKFTEDDNTATWGAGADSVLIIVDSNGDEWTTVRHGPQGAYDSFDVIKNGDLIGTMEVTYDSNGNAETGIYVHSDTDGWAEQDSTGNEVDDGCCGGPEEPPTFESTDPVVTAGVYRARDFAAAMDLRRYVKRCLTGLDGVQSAGIGAGILSLVLGSCSTEEDRMWQEGEEAGWATLGGVITWFAVPGDPIDWLVGLTFAKETGEFLAAIGTWALCKL